GQRLERALAILGQDDRALARFEHLDVAAERQQRDAVLRLATAQLEDLRAETQTKGQDFDAERLREQKMPKLVDEDQRADEDDEVEQVHAGSCSAAAPSFGQAFRPARLAQSRRPTPVLPRRRGPTGRRPARAAAGPLEHERRARTPRLFALMVLP